jgi:hypothetical protein
MPSWEADVVVVRILFYPYIGTRGRSTIQQSEGHAASCPSPSASHLGVNTAGRSHRLSRSTCTAATSRTHAHVRSERPQGSLLLVTAPLVAGGCGCESISRTWKDCTRPRGKCCNTVTCDITTSVSLCSSSPY